MSVEQPSTPLHIHGTILPGTEPLDVWVRGGQVTFERVPGATTVARDAFVLPGLVDAHCHLGLGPQGAVDEDTTEAQARADLASGVMLARDAGSPADTRWLQARADMPRLVRAGRHIARPKRYLRNLPVEVEPDGLVEEVRLQAKAGNGWVKLVGDWIDRDQGDLSSLWPAYIAAEAIQAAHEEGARVTAHCFAEESVAELVAAGIDCIEHGTGLSAGVIDEMARRSTALVPTLINLDNFPMYAEPAKEKFPAYHHHMHDLYDRRHQTIGAAIEAGVEVFCGTDAGTVVAHGRVQDEIAELAKLGGAEFALGAASWRARAWLGARGIEEGASADLIVCDHDPRLDLGALRSPQLMILRGRKVIES